MATGWLAGWLAGRPDSCLARAEWVPCPRSSIIHKYSGWMAPRMRAAAAAHPIGPVELFSSFWDCVALRRCGGLHAPPVSIWKSALMDGFLRLVPKAADWLSGWLAVGSPPPPPPPPPVVLLACFLASNSGTGRGSIVGGWETLSVSFRERASERPSQQSTLLRCRTEERKCQLSG
ncbi:hypothetical protein IWZ03DRAFT_22711 [Phyllosticta citriasiana]|uniref:Uncharacterized protein n=1 Tax=Phyllosticta citriasiana TaxID=595635 RepID=A0ABR1KZQ7_9PEZI